MTLPEGMSYYVSLQEAIGYLGVADDPKSQSVKPPEKETLMRNGKLDGTFLKTHGHVFWICYNMTV